MTHRGSTPVLVQRRDGSSAAFERDTLVVEEPLEIRIRNGASGEATPFVVTMRTPGDDEDLCVGLLYGEGLVNSLDDVLDVRRPEDPRISAELARNVLVATLVRREPDERTPVTRSTVMGSACGVCGRTTIEDVLRLVAGAGRPRSPLTVEPMVDAAVLTALPGSLRGGQELFSTTGGLHAAGLFDVDGTPVLSREDVGRHNATDKAIGALLRGRRSTPPLMLVSGRLGFEIVQKAALAGVRVLCAISAPTSLAVDLAEEAGITLVGFLRGERFNVYTHGGRIRNGLDPTSRII